ncbi:unnamed protein product [Eruca vesicaria subsp. sativa]|uniref:Uncharacterized protein n=1 Tax=Eruca vesicaria subsp. sativa TaxID=29727 RepID=A0ABC8M6B6_ERUVS|nr:unnamed protein product [Eruca vesicaria subsp. sativa]
MDKESATPALNVIKKDMNENTISDVIEMLRGLVDRLEKMEEKVDHRLQKMEEKVDMLISSVSLSNASMKTGTVKAEADNMSVDESSSDDEEPIRKKNSEVHTSNPKKAKTNRSSHFGPFVPFGFDEEPYSQTGFGKKKNHNNFNQFSGGGPSSLNVGGRFAGGRCGGLGQCSFC